MSDVDTTTIRWKKRLQESYREETGHELPDHVVDNLGLVTSRIPLGVEEMESQRRLEVEAVSDDEPAPQQYLLFIGDVALSGLIGLQVSRFFTGTLAQIAGGALVGALAFVVLTFILLSGGA